MQNWQQLDQTYIMSTVKRYPIAISKAEGNYLYDTEGNRYLDLFTGLAVNILGHSHPKIIAALEEQSHRFLHISNLFLNPPAIRLAQRLVQHTFGQGKVYFCNSGAEATEAAIKLVHKWIARQPHKRHGIVALKNSFHGRTLGALRLTRQPGVYQDYPQPPFPVYEVEPNQVESLLETCRTHKPAAIIVEPILGAGGVVSLEPAFLQAIDELCKEEGMLFIIDEIQTGMGRTGQLFAYQHFSLSPDVVLFAKGIGGGLPLGGMIAGHKTADLFQPGDHGTTFAPSPLSAALGNVVLDLLLEDGMLEHGRKMADYLWSELQRLQKDYPHVFQGLDGRGMMLGIRTHLTAEQINRLHRRLLEEGILVNVTAKTIIRLLPPLTLTEKEIAFFIEKLERIANEL